MFCIFAFARITTTLLVYHASPLLCDLSKTSVSAQHYVDIWWIRAEFMVRKLNFQFSHILHSQTSYYIMVTLLWLISTIYHPPDPPCRFGLVWWMTFLVATHCPGFCPVPQLATDKIALNGLRGLGTSHREATGLVPASSRPIWMIFTVGLCSRKSRHIALVFALCLT